MAKSHTNGNELLPHGTAASFSPSNRLPLLIWQLGNDLLDRIQRRWMCFAWTAVFPCARWWRGLLGQSHFFWSPDAEGTFYSTHITQMALFQPFQKTGIASVSCISQNHFERHLPAQRLINQLEGDLVFRLCWDLVRHVSSFTALAICGP
jgi:hypothetical protein